MGHMQVSEDVYRCFARGQIQLSGQGTDTGAWPKDRSLTKTLVVMLVGTIVEVQASLKNKILH